MRAARAPVLCWCAGLILLRPALAADRTVGIDYQAPANCPPAGEFMALVSARTEGTWRLREGAGEPRFAVEIRQLATGTRGRLQRSRAGRPTEAREVSGGDCREVVRALVLTTALSLDAEAAEAIVVAAPPRASASVAPAASTTLWTLGAGVGASAALPNVPLGELAAFVEAGPALAATGWRRPDLRLALGYARSGALPAVERATFSLASAELAACPFGWRWLRLCATGDAGVLVGQGRQIEHPQTSRTLWGALGAAGSARWAAGHGFVLEAHAGVHLPVRRTDFVLQVPRTPVTTVRPAFLAGGLSVGRSIP